MESYVPPRKSEIQMKETLLISSSKNKGSRLSYISKGSTITPAQDFLTFRRPSNLFGVDESRSINRPVDFGKKLLGDFGLNKP